MAAIRWLSPSHMEYDMSDFQVRELLKFCFGALFCAVLAVFSICLGDYTPEWSGRAAGHASRRQIQAHRVCASAKPFAQARYVRGAVGAINTVVMERDTRGRLVSCKYRYGIH